MNIRKDEERTETKENRGGRNVNTTLLALENEWKSNGHECFIYCWQKILTKRYCEITVTLTLKAVKAAVFSGIKQE